MRKRRLKNWIESYVEYTQHSEAPDRFHKWTAVSTIAGALRRRVQINMGYFQWTPNFFILFVAPPGVVSKSTTAEIGMSLLRRLDYIKFGPSAVTWQALVKSLSESTEEIMLPGGQEFMPMSAITIVASELGTFLDPRNREMIDVLVSLWDGRQEGWKKITKLDGEEIIQNPWINLIGCTTPAWVAENFSDYFIGGGFASRTIFVYAEAKRKLVAYPGLHLPENFAQQADDLVHDLEIISSLLGEYKLTQAAYDWGTQWYEKHYTTDNPLLRGERFKGYMARKQTHIHKLAMVISASKRDDLIITDRDLATADKWVSELEQDMPLVFGEMNKEKEAMMASNILDFLRVEGKIESDRLFRHFMRQMNVQSYDLAMKALSQASLVNYTNEEGKVWVEINLTEEQRKALSTLG